jgi:cAMP-dependent protein kinase regulator
VIIRQYSNGDDLYVVASGRLECKRRNKPTEEDVVLKQYTPGEAFGELALLYNCPRAATITALENSVLYQLDRQTFSHIVRDSAIKRRERFENLLANIELLSTMDSYERIKIGDCLKALKYKAGELVVKEVPLPFGSH